MNVEAQIKRGRKFDQVLEGARQVFMREGYEGASVDMIAKAAGVSKATLYSYFPDKSMLFVEVAKGECNRQAEMSFRVEGADVDVEKTLYGIGHNIVDFVTSPLAQRVFRICVAESDRFPELGQEFYETGPRQAKKLMAEYLSMAVDNGLLKIDDIPLAAQQFGELCKCDLFDRMVFNIIKQPTQAEKDRVVDGAVKTFLARYAA